MLDQRAGQPQVGRAEVFLDAQQVEARRGDRRGAEVLAVDLRAEGQLLQVVETRGALDVGKVSLI